MVGKLSAMLGFMVSTTDGILGQLHDVYYDDRHWTVRYLVVGDLEGVEGTRLISPHAVAAVSYERETILLNLDRGQVLAAPDVGEDMPVSMRAEMAYYDYFGWPYYWHGPYAWGAWPVPAPAAPPLASTQVPASPGRSEAVVDALKEGDEESHHLRSVDETIGYHVQALDDEIGHIEDFLLDDRSWRLEAVVVDTSNWWFGKKVALPSEKFTAIDWSTRLIWVDETREQVKASREIDLSLLPTDGEAAA